MPRRGGNVSAARFLTGILGVVRSAEKPAALNAITKSRLPRAGRSGIPRTFKPFAECAILRKQRESVPAESSGPPGVNSVMSC